MDTDSTRYRPGGQEFLPDDLLELGVSAADINMFLQAPASMNCNNRFGFRRQIDPDRFVKIAAADMQNQIAVNFNSFETVKAVIHPGDGIGDLGGSGFDAASVGCHDDNTRTTATPLYSKVCSLDFLFLQFLE